MLKLAEMSWAQLPPSGPYLIAGHPGMALGPVGPPGGAFYPPPHYFHPHPHPAMQSYAQQQPPLPLPAYSASAPSASAATSAALSSAVSTNASAPAFNGAKQPPGPGQAAGSGSVPMFATLPTPLQYAHPPPPITATVLPPPSVPAPSAAAVLPSGAAFPSVKGPGTTQQLPAKYWPQPPSSLMDEALSASMAAATVRERPTDGASADAVAATASELAVSRAALPTIPLPPPSLVPRRFPGFPRRSVGPRGAPPLLSQRSMPVLRSAGAPVNAKERAEVRARIRAACVRQLPRYEDLLAVLSALQEERMYATQQSRLAYMKAHVELSARIERTARDGPGPLDVLSRVLPRVDEEKEADNQLSTSSPARAPTPGTWSDALSGLSTLADVTSRERRRSRSRDRSQLREGSAAEAKNGHAAADTWQMEVTESTVKTEPEHKKRRTEQAVVRRRAEIVT